MIADRLDIVGLLLIEAEKYCDQRGFFNCVWDNNILHEGKPIITPSSVNFSYNKHVNTLRGMHFQKDPYSQKKMVTCVSGRIYDVVVDLRKSSPSYRKWVGLEMDSNQGVSLLIPKGCAHGFLTLEENSIVSYIIEGNYISTASMTLLWNDPVIGIQWPVKSPFISKKDAESPSFDCI